MMVWRKPLVFGVDAAGCAAAAGLGLFLLCGAVLPWQRDARDLAWLRRELPDARARCQKLQARNHATAQALEALDGALRAQAGRAPLDTGDFLEYVTEQCRQCGVTLQQVQPAAIKTEGAYHSWDVQVRAKGAFPDFQELLRRLESWSPYVQVNGLLVQGPQPGAEAVCELSWTIRVNYMPEEAQRQKEPKKGK